MSERAKRRKSLTAQIRKLHVGHHASCGSPRVHQELLARGEAVHEKTVAKVMREAGIQAKSQRIDRRLVVDVLEMAVSRELPDAGLVAHSDRGVQYASEHFQGVLTQHDLECSMSCKGNCWDNAPVESFFATLKKELVHHETYATRAAARAYSMTSKCSTTASDGHSALGYLSPSRKRRNRL